MTSIRAIKPVGISDLKPRPPTTPMPVCKLVDPSTLFVDQSYQRQIGERGRKQIRKIVQEFCWTRFKPPICAYSDRQGSKVLMVLDGQHTAIAAASNPHVSQIPVMVVEAPGVSSQANAFVGQNTARLGVTPLQLFQASLVAGDEDALTAEQVCQRAGLTILRGPAGTDRYEARQTIAVDTIKGLVTRQTAMGARRILEVLANADLAPVTTHHIRAAEYLMTDKDCKLRFEPEDLTKAIAETYLVADEEAKVFGHAHRIPYWKALATIWFRRTKKRRNHLRIAA